MSDQRNTDVEVAEGEALSNEAPLRSYIRRPLKSLVAGITPAQAMLLSVITTHGCDLKSMNYTSSGAEAEFVFEGKVYRLDLRSLGPAGGDAA